MKYAYYWIIINNVTVIIRFWIKGKTDGNPDLRYDHKIYKILVMNVSIDRSQFLLLPWGGCIGYICHLKTYQNYKQGLCHFNPDPRNQFRISYFVNTPY